MDGNELFYEEFELVKYCRVNVVKGMCLLGNRIIENFEYNEKRHGKYPEIVKLFIKNFTDHDTDMFNIDMLEDFAGGYIADVRINMLLGEVFKVMNGV